MEIWINILREFGPWGVLLLSIIYLLINSEFTIKYPRKSKNTN